MGELSAIPIWLCIPFAGLLLSIAVMPLIKPDWWEKHQPLAVAFWSILFIIPFTAKYGIFTMSETVLECVVNDYLTFIVLLFGLFCVAGNITIDGEFAGSPRINTALFVFGTLLSSVIGTTGSSMLLVRPFIKMNSWRKRKSHIMIFFIFLISNMGGCLTPIGDPPLLMGFMRGVPFFWSMKLFHILVFNMVILLVIFYFLDRRAYRKDIAKRLKQKDLPQVDILLVVNMFLTGFDAKPLNTLYLDKNLIWHSLVQAYSRTNRVDKVTKQFGQIVSYRNIKQWQDDALTLFSGDGDPNEYLLENYEYYLNQWVNQEPVLRKITADVDAAGQLKSEDEIRMFIIAFRSMAKTLATLKTFSKFDWDDLAVVMNENEYEGFKSWYLYYKDQTHNPNPKVPVPVDVDFDIELVRTDRINVVYILNLLKNANTHDKTEEEKQQDVDLILREIERSDNESLRLKKEVMRQFILTRFYDLPEDADVMEAFAQFEKEQMKADMEEFAFDNKIDYMIVSELFTEYVFHGTISDDDIRKRLTSYKLGLLKMTKLTKSVKTFVRTT